MAKKHRKKKPRRVGASPGTLLVIGDAKSATIRSMIISDEALLDEVLTAEALETRSVDPGKTEWIAIEGLEDVDLLRALGSALNIHVLSLEDALNPDHLPKLDVFETYAFVVLKSCTFAPEDLSFSFEPVALALMQDRVLTMHNGTRDELFAPVLERLTIGTGRIRSGFDYLFYALIDLLVDHYYPLLDMVEDEIERMEELVLEGASQETLKRMHDFRRGIHQLLKVVTPIREVANGLLQGRTPFISDTTRMYLSDVYDHVIYLTQTLEQYREMLSGLVELHMSIESNRMNQVMKVLTIIATTFIPLTFVAGVYGMNFEFMPELSWPWAYPMVWGIMITIGITMLMFFRRRKWI